MSYLRQCLRVFLALNRAPEIHYYYGQCLGKLTATVFIFLKKLVVETSTPAAKAGQEERIISRQCGFIQEEPEVPADLHHIPTATLPILESTHCESPSQKDSSQTGIGDWENKLCFQLWHISPCSCQTSQSVCGRLQVLLQIQTKSCVLSASGKDCRKWLFRFSLYCLWCRQPKCHMVCISEPCKKSREGVQREDWEKANEFLFLPLSICFWGEQKSQGEHTQDAVWLAQSYH